MSSSDYEKRFQQLYKLFSEVYIMFYVWKGLQDKSFEKTYSENSAFWSAVLRALENNWLTGLAKIYEYSKYSKAAKVISVYALLPYQADTARAIKALKIIKKNSKVIEGIEKLRHHQLAHNNASHLINPKKILRKFPIIYKEAEELIIASGDILSNLNPQKSVGYAYKMLADDCEADGKHIIKKLRYYSQLHEEWIEKIKKREVSPMDKFPPLKD